MDKILSIQTIKNVFAALGAKTSDSNYGVALLDKTTAEPKGLMGMSDLASVLGGVITTMSVSADLNNQKTTGLYGITPQESTWESLHYPSVNWGILRITQCTSNPTGVIQEIYGYGGSKYQRAFYQNNWLPWIRLDNFGCNDLSSLASALGAYITKLTPLYGSLTDYNVAFEAGKFAIFYNSNSSGITSRPPLFGSGWQCCISFGFNSQRCVQIAIDGERSLIQKRFGVPSGSSGTTWSEWADF